MKKLLLPLLLLAALSGGFWLYTGPQRALAGIKASADAGDAEGIRERVDMPALRESLKEQFSALMQEKMATELKDNPFAGLGMMMAGTFVDKAVENFVTPAGLVKMLGGTKGAVVTDDKEAAEAEVAAADNQPDISGSFDSLDRYTMLVKKKGSDQPGLKLTMRREGFSWKLTSIQLPIDELTKDENVAAE